MRVVQANLGTDANRVVLTPRYPIKIIFGAPMFIAGIPLDYFCFDFTHFGVPVAVSSNWLK